MKTRKGFALKWTLYHVIKNKDPYTDYPKLLKLQTKNIVLQLLKSKTQSSYATDDIGAIFGNFIGHCNVDLLKKDLDKINYFSVLTDGSTDASITEQEAMYILLLNDGVPKAWYFSVESVKNTNAAGIHNSTQTVFNRFGVTKFEDRIVGLNADGTSINMGPLNGLEKIVKDSTPWLQLVHCLNHCIKLSLKDAFDTSPFGDIDNMLMKLYYLYEKSPKWYRVKRTLSRLMQIVFQSYLKHMGLDG